MEKPAHTQYAIHELLRNRWSPRAFSEKPVSSETLGSLLEAARWAPSCFNEQPWRFIVATKNRPQEYDALLACMAQANQRWAERAPVLMLSVASLNFVRNGRPNRHAFHDVGLAVENMVLQAQALGLAVHQMAGFDVAKARDSFKIPESFEPVAMIAIGYQGDSEALPEDLREREDAPRTRNPMRNWVFRGTWGQSAVFSEKDRG